MVEYWSTSGVVMPFSAPSWKRAVDWSAVAPGGVTDSSRPGSVGHLVTEVTKCALPSPVAGRSTTLTFTLTGGSLSAQQAFCVKNVYWLPQMPWIVETALAFHWSCSSVVQLNCSAL